MFDWRRAKNGNFIAAANQIVLIDEQIIAAAAPHYAVFAYDEGTAQEIRAARLKFDEMALDAYQGVVRSALMKGFHRPTAGEFREELMDRCRKFARQKGLI